MGSLRGRDAPLALRGGTQPNLPPGNPVLPAMNLKPLEIEKSLG
jgi:hypothetical protein